MGTEQVDLEDFLLRQGFIRKFGLNGRTCFDYGPEWTSKYINGSIIPLQFVRSKNNQWHCYLHGLLLPVVPEPNHLLILLEQLKSYGIK